MLTKLLTPERRSEKIDPMHPRDPALARMFNLGVETEADIPINEDTAMRFSAVYASVRVISETFGSLPCGVFERLSTGGRAKVTQHPAVALMCAEPSPDYTPLVYREAKCAHVTTWGNAYSEIVTDRRGAPTELILQVPRDVRVKRNKRTGLLEYEVTNEDGSVRTLDRSQMLHVPGLGGDGLVGWSPIGLFKEAIAVGLAAERFGARFFGKSANPSGAMEVPEELGEDAYNRLKKDVNDEYGGRNSGNVLLLEGGAKWKQITVPPEHAQFIQTRQFQVGDIARIFRIPPHMIGDLEHATFSNIEQQSLDFEKHTIRPWLVRFEQEINRKLFRKRDQGRLFIKFNVDGLLRADIKTRFEAYSIGFQNGWLNLDTISEKEDMNPLPAGHGKIHWVSQQVRPIEIALQEPEPPNTDDDPPEDPGGDPPEDDNNPDGQRFLQHLVEDNVRGMIGREIVQARDAAKRPKKFLEWLDSFYADHEGRMTARFGENAGDAIVEHVTESKRMLLEASGNATADNLPGVIAELVAEWDSRAEQLASSILKGNDNGH